MPAPGGSDFGVRVPFAIKRLSSEARAASPEAQVGFDLTEGVPCWERPGPSAGRAGPYVDALVSRPGRGSVTASDVARRWIVSPRGDSPSAAGDVIRLLLSDGRTRRPRALVVLTSEGGVAAVRAGREVPLATRGVCLGRRLAASRRQGATSTGGAATVLRLFDAKALTPILLLPQDSRRRRSRSRSNGGPFAKASRREPRLGGAKRDFDLTAGDLAFARPVPRIARRRASARRAAGGETRADVEVAATRGLTVEEIVARERVWDAGQREKTPSFIAHMKTSLRFRVADVNETFDLTIDGGYFYFERGKPPDWAWHEFYLNGVKWKGRTLPKLPILAAARRSRRCRSTSA